MRVRLQNPAIRGALPLRRDPYFTKIFQGLFLGYRVTSDKEEANTWVARRWNGSKYLYKTLGLASDTEGQAGFSYEEALEKAVRWTGRSDDSPRGRSVYAVENACADYTADLRARGKRSASIVEGSFRRYVATHRIRNRLLEELNARELKRWHAWVAEQSRRNNAAVNAEPEEDARRRRANANRILSQLKAALNLAYNEELVEAKPWERVKPFQGVERPRRWFLTMEEVPRFVAACEPESFRELAMAALYCGASYGELTRLTREHYFAEAGVLMIERAKTGVTAQIPLAGEATEFFAQIVARRGPGELLFQREPGRGWRTNEQQRPFRAAMERAGLTGGSFHGLRHTFASHAVMRGWSLSVVARVLGHTSTRMVERHYGHLAPSHVMQIVQASPADYGLSNRSEQ